MNGRFASGLSFFRILLIAFGFAVISASGALGQANASARVALPETSNIATPLPSFEVASIRLDKSDIHARSHIYSSPNNGHFTAINVPVRLLLQFAFGIPESRIFGGPVWLSSDKYDIEAKADESVDGQMDKLTSDQGKLVKQQMLQALFADRFQLKVHHETRVLPVYVLVVAKNGPKLKESKAKGCTTNSGRDSISIQGCASVATLAEKLAENLGRIVIDKTGIEGGFDIDLKWTPDDGTAPKLNGTAEPLTDASWPSIFTALDEQLGLKLESKKGPVDVIVIDHIERPSAN
jgi:uncharacterized protein (TIGR03435 family)